MFLSFPSFLEDFPTSSLAFILRAVGDLSRKLGPFHISLKLIYSLGGADGNRTHVLKVTELHRGGSPLYCSIIFIIMGLETGHANAT